MLVIRYVLVALLATAALLGPDTGFAQERLRGFMVSTHAGAADLRQARAWGANLVRWQLQTHQSQVPAAQYYAWLDGVLNHLDSTLPVCQQLQLRVVIDLHSPPGGQDRSKRHRVFTNGRRRQQFLEAWRRIASRLRRHPSVYAYDLLNEPRGTTAEWRPLAREAARIVRRQHTNPWIVVESVYGDPTLLARFQPLPLRRVMYSVHMYRPSAFTHQGIDGRPNGVRYPGRIGRKHWDRAALRRVLAGVIDYKRRHRVPIYIGEFSAVRWAPGAERYLADLIDIFERNGFSWSYHAWRESQVWSLELGPDPNNLTHLSSNWPAARVVRQGLARNW